MIKHEIYSWLQDLLGEGPKLERIVLNSAFTGAVLDNGDMGMAMNVRSGCSTNKKINDFLQDKVNTFGMAAASDILETIDRNDLIQSPEEKHIIHSVLIALYNALSRPFMNKEYLKGIGCQVAHGQTKGSSESVTPGETVAIVGFGGMVRSLAKIAASTYVTELEPSLFSSTLISARGVDQGPDCCTIVPAGQGAAYFKRADTVFVTGCALVTDTMDEILEHCSGKNIIAYGITAGFLPQPLLDRGVTRIRSGIIKNSNLMVDLLLNCAGAVERFFPLASESMVITSERTGR